MSWSSTRQMTGLELVTRSDGRPEQGFESYVNVWGLRIFFKGGRPHIQKRGGL